MNEGASSGERGRGARRAYLGLGSNLGDRLAHLQAAVDGLAALDGTVLVACSQVYETRPVGPGQPDFLNAVIAVSTDRSPRELLDAGQRLEAEAARVRDVRWGPRTLDVDLLVVEGTEVDEPDLTVPHPRAFERGFVLAPLADVAPHLVDPPAGGWPGVRVAPVALRHPRGGRSPS